MSTDVTAMAQLPSDLRDAFDRLAEDAVGEFGPTPLARLVLAHLVLFVELRRRGASWAQIADLLAAAGVVGSDGPFAADVVRATYARAAADATQRKRTGRNATKRDEGNRNAAKSDVTQRNAAERTEMKPGEALDDASAATPRMQGEAASTPPGPPRTGPARNAPGERNPDPNEHGLADLFRRAAFLHNPANRR
jgi:hypothetical protein